MSKKTNRPFSFSPQLAKSIRTFQEEMKNLLPCLYEYEIDQEQEEHDPEQSPILPKDSENFKEHSSDILSEKNIFQHRGNENRIKTDNNIFECSESNFFSESDNSFSSTGKNIKTKKNDITFSAKNNTSVQKQDLAKEDKPFGEEESPNETERRSSKRVSNSISENDNKNSVGSNSVQMRNSLDSNQVFFKNSERNTPKVDREITSDEVEVKNTSNIITKTTNNKDGIKSNGIECSAMETISNENISLSRKQSGSGKNGHLPKQNGKKSQTEISHFSELGSIASPELFHFPERENRMNLFEILSGVEDLFFEKKQLENCLRGINEIKRKLDWLARKQEKDRDEKKEIKILID